MILYLAGAEQEKPELLSRLTNSNLLFSYIYNPIKVVSIPHNVLGGLSFVDSGAFSAWTKGVKINTDMYIYWLNKNDNSIDLFGQLDAIPGDRNHFTSQKGCIKFANTDVQDAIMHRYRKNEDSHRNSLIQYLEDSLTLAEENQKERFWDELSTQYWAMKSRYEYEELMAEKLYLLISQYEVFEYLYNKRASKMVAFNGAGKQIYRYWSWLYNYDCAKYSLLTYIEEEKCPETDFLSMACDIIDVAEHAGDLDTVVLTLHRARQLSKKGVTISDKRQKILIGNLSLLSLVALEWDLKTTNELLDKEISESSFFKEETVL